MDRISFLMRVFWASPNTLPGLLIGRRFYRDNPFEREAYDADGGEHDA